MKLDHAIYAEIRRVVVDVHRGFKRVDADAVDDAVQEIAIAVARGGVDNVKAYARTVARRLFLAERRSASAGDPDLALRETPGDRMGAALERAWAITATEEEAREADAVRNHAGNISETARKYGFSREKVRNLLMRWQETDSIQVEREDDGARDVDSSTAEALAPNADARRRRSRRVHDDRPAIRGGDADGHPDGARGRRGARDAGRPSRDLGSFFAAMSDEDSHADAVARDLTSALMLNIAVAGGVSEESVRRYFSVPRRPMREATIEHIERALRALGHPHLIRPRAA